MSNIDNNTSSSLLGFLQKKSLFSNSPNPRSRNRSRSGSKEGRFLGSKSNIYQLDDRSEVPSDRSGNKFIHQDDNLRNYQTNPVNLNENNREQNWNRNHNGTPKSNLYQYSDQINYSSNQNNYKNIPQNTYNFANQNSELQNSPHQFQTNYNLNYQNSPNQFQSDLRGVTSTSPISELRTENRQEQHYFKTSSAQSDRFRQQYSGNPLLPDNPALQNQIWSGLVAHNTSFQSARIQSIQCLESLSSKLNAEISNINFKIDSFNSKMGKALSAEFRSIKDRLQQMFEQVFKESERYIKEYMRQQESKMAGQLLRVRETLSKEHSRIEMMKEELRKSNWRKTAGQILTTELQKKIEQTIRMSNDINIGQWELGDIGSSRIKNIESELKQIIRIQPR